MSNVAPLKLFDDRPPPRVDDSYAPAGKVSLRSVAPWERPRAKAEPSSRPAYRNGVPEQRHMTALAAYLGDVRHHTVLSREEEHRIAVEYAETGDPRLGARLVTANLRIVVKIALEFRSSRHQLADLVQEGNTGLVHALGKYDPSRELRFATYASWWIRAYILKFIMANTRLVRLGTTQAQRRLFFGLRRERARIERQSGVGAEPKQIAEALGVRERDVVDMERRLAATDTSLDAPARPSDGDRSRGDSFGADDADRPDARFERAEIDARVRREVDAFRATLTGRDAAIFAARFDADPGATLAEIAGKFGVSRERVRQLEERLKARLRARLHASLGDAAPRCGGRAGAASAKKGAQGGDVDFEDARANASEPS